MLIVVLFAGCILHPAAPGYGTPAEAYAALPAAQGVLDGDLDRVVEPLILADREEKLKQSSTEEGK